MSVRLQESRRLIKRRLLFGLLIMFALTVRPASSASVLFFDDFSSDEIGTPPKAWSVESEPGCIEVVAADGPASERAVHIVAHPERRETRMSAPLADTESGTIIVEHQVRWVSGKGINLYVTKSGHNLNWFITDTGQLGYRASRGNSTYTVTVGNLKAGWNRIRLVADRESNEVFVYLNDMDTPAAGPLTLRTPLDSWRGARLIVQHTYNQDPGDVHYADFKIYVPDEQTPQTRIPVRSSVWRGDLPKRPAPEPPDSRPATVTRERIPLRVAERRGLDRRAQPVSSGVPLPSGQLWDSASVRLLDPRGLQVPLQTEILSHWPDGSIRWLLLDFQADLAADTVGEYTLEYGSEVSGSSVAGISVKEDSDAISVDTGPLAVTFGKKGSLWRSIQVDGKSWNNALSPEITFHGAGGLTATTSDAPHTLEIEEAGSERVVVRAYGEIHRVQGDESLNFAYDIRFHFFRDSDVIRIDPTITNLKGWEPHIGLSYTDLTRVCLRLPGWVPAKEFAFHVGTDGEPVWGQGARFQLLQSDADAFEVVADGRQIGSGRHAAGWVEISNGDRLLSLGVRHFWEQAPKAIGVNGEGDLVVDLWAEQDRHLIMGGGEAKRHELYVCLGDTGTETVKGMLDPLRAVAPPSWYSATGGFGRPFLLIEEDELALYEPHVAIYEEFVRKGYERLMENRSRLEEYGWRNFGDWSTTWDNDGWGNNEYDLGHVYFQQFARTGDLGFFDLAETAARHWMDIDLIWAANNRWWLGGGLQHSEAHRRYAAADHTWNQGFIDYYHLTGDRRSLQAAQAIGDFFAYLAFERPNQRRPRVVQTADKDLPTRNPGWALIALVSLYESTLDPYYLKAAETVVDIIAEEQQPDGQWTYRIPANEIESRPIATKPFMTAIILRALGDYHRVTADARAADMLVRGLRFLVEELWCPETRGYPYIDHPQYSPQVANTNLLLLDAFAYAYELTGESRFAEVAMQGFRSTIERQIAQLGSPNLGKTVAQALRHTPQSLAVLVQPKEMVLSGPSRVSVGRSGAVEVEVTITRLDAAESFRGTLTIENLPPGLVPAPDKIPYVLAPGQKKITVPLTLEAKATAAPGNYEPVLTDKARSELTLTLPVTLPGWRLVDDFRPPVVHSWFGEAAFQVWEEQSEGWQHATETAESFFDDVNRLHRSKETEEYLIYDVPGLFDFALTFYAPVSRQQEVAAQIQIDMKDERGSWQTIPTEVSWTLP
ncbi:MAG: hypothetical protein ACOYEP_02330, partial [Limnochordia bacterium]